MFSELCSGSFCLFLKLRVAAALFLVMLLWPYFRYLDHQEGGAQMAQFCQKVRGGSQENTAEVAFNEFLEVLSRNTYVGVWQSSIKQSKLLKQQNGTIQLKTNKKASENSQNTYSINIKIYDGQYRDQGNYNIEMDSSSVRTEQQYGVNQVIYETTAPLIGLRRSEKIFRTQKQKPLFINKLKFRLNAKENLKIELLLAAEYDINIITESLEESWDLFHEIVFAVLILAQVLAQAYGSYGLLVEADDQDLIAYSISPTFLKLGICFDTAELFVLLYLIYYQKMIMLVVPAYFLFMLVIFLETYLYSKVTGTSKPHTVRQQFQRIEREVIGDGSAQALAPAPESSLLLNQPLKSLVETLQRNQDYLACIVSYLIFYVNNMQNYIYLVFFLILLLPQITRNCRIANKINYEIENILFSAYPRLIPIVYLRVFGLKSRFLFEPHYVFCLACGLFVIGSGFVLYVQKMHGARSILPKFLIPKGMKTKFKFFAIQDENLNCIVCRSELSQIPAELKQKSEPSIKQQIIYNKVVLTPCHHKFHAHCLQKWMQNRTQCPSCPHTLPPVDSY